MFIKQITGVRQLNNRIPGPGLRCLAKADSSVATLLGHSTLGLRSIKLLLVWLNRTNWTFSSSGEQLVYQNSGPYQASLPATDYSHSLRPPPN